MVDIFICNMYTYKICNMYTYKMYMYFYMFYVIALFSSPNITLMLRNSCFQRCTMQFVLHNMRLHVEHGILYIQLFLLPGVNYELSKWLAQQLSPYIGTISNSHIINSLDLVSSYPHWLLIIITNLSVLMSNHCLQMFQLTVYCILWRINFQIVFFQSI